MYWGGETRLVQIPLSRISLTFSVELRGGSAMANTEQEKLDL